MVTRVYFLMLHKENTNKSYKYKQITGRCINTQLYNNDMLDYVCENKLFNNVYFFRTYDRQVLSYGKSRNQVKNKHIFRRRQIKNKQLTNVFTFISF